MTISAAAYGDAAKMIWLELILRPVKLRGMRRQLSENAVSFAMFPQKWIRGVHQSAADRWALSKITDISR